MLRGLDPRFSHMFLVEDGSSLPLIQAAWEFVVIQLVGIFGHDELADFHIIYLVHSWCAYIGRATLVRRRDEHSLMPLGGGSRRWSEHMRDLHHQRCRSGCPSRFRRRYEALDGGSQSFLGFLVLTVVPLAEVFGGEAARICIASPYANNLMNQVQPKKRRRGKQPRSKRPHLCKSLAEKKKHATAVEDVEASSLSFCARVGALASRYCNSLAESNRFMGLMNAFRGSFSKFYDYRRRRDLLGCEGPISIAGLSCAWLLLRYAAWKPFQVAWSQVLITRGWSVDRMYYLFDLASHIPKYTQRSRVRGSIRKFLASSGWCSADRFPILMVESLLRPSLRSWCQKVIACFRVVTPWWSKYVASRVSIVQAASPTWRVSLVNVQKAFRHFDFVHLMSFAKHWTEDQVKMILDGYDLVRVPLPSKLLQQRDGKSKIDEQRSHCCEWLRRCGLSTFYGLVDSVRLTEVKDDGDFRAWGSWLEASRVFADLHDRVCGSTSAESKQYTCIGGGEQYPAPPSHVNIGALAIQSRSLVVTIEDKDPAILWAQSEACMMIRCIVALPSHRWGIVQLDVFRVCCWYRVLIMASLPANLRGPTKYIDRMCLPYMYQSIKRKCFRNSGHDADPCLAPRTCRKVDHSCARNIISFVRIPCRKAYRRVGRAFQHVLRYVWPCWSFSDLSLAPSEMSERYNIQYPRPNLSDLARPCCLCACCSAKMTKPSVVIMDAGQAYETVDLPFLINSISRLVETARRSDCPSAVWVKRQAKSCAGFGGRCKDGVVDRDVYFFDTLQQCFLCFLLMRVYVLGNLFVIQKSGVPIGGPLSTMCLETALARLENLFDEHGWRRSKWGRLLPGARERWVTLGRYADDIIAISRWVCCGCLKKMILSVFPRSGVVFEDSGVVSDPSAYVSIFKYLDVTWILDCNKLIPTMQSPNLVLVLSGSTDTEKSRFTPNAFSHRDSIGRLVADISGRAARWRQISLNDDFVSHAILLDTVELLLAGYPLALIDEAWCRSRGARRYRSLFTQVKHQLLSQQASHSPIHIRSQSLSSQISSQLDKAALFAADLTSTLVRVSDDWSRAMGRGGDGRNGGHGGGGYGYDRGNDNRGQDNRGGHGNQRDWQDHRQQPYRHSGGNKGEGDPLCKLANDFQSTLGSLKSLGEMCQLGQTLSAAGTGLPSSSPSGVAGAVQAASPDKGAPNTAALSDALVRILAGSQPSAGTPPPAVAADVTPGSLIVDQLRGQGASTPNVFSQDSFEKMLSVSPSFTGMNTRVSNLQEAALDHKMSIEKISARQTSDSSTLAEILSAVKGGESRPKGEVPPGSATPMKKEDRSAILIDYDCHKKFCEKMSISLTREFIKFEEYDKDPKDSVAFDKWGTSVMRCKSLNQWIAKVSSLHGDEAVTDISSLADALEVVLVKDPTILRP